ncbi:MAG: universal stress protein [Solirubrobacteraceae bacterium]
MYRTIVAGCNGRDRGRGAVSLAHALATATGARLLIVGVQLNPTVPFEAFGTVHEKLEHDLKAIRDELAPGARVRVEPALSPAHALARVAEAEGAELIVVGSRHRRRLQHIAETDHAMQVLHGAACAVAVAPDPLPPRVALRTIGVGVDDTPESGVAVEMARALAERTDARLMLRAVVDDTTPPWMGLAGTATYIDAHQASVDARREQAQRLIDDRLAACAGVRAEGAVVCGDPAGELSLLSEELDLLVLGSRRWGAVKRLALGSTSERVIRHAGCPVLVPPRGAGAEHAPAEPSARDTVAS